VRRPRPSGLPVFKPDVGGKFDADGDGEAEIRFYNGWRGGEDIVGPVEYDDAGNAKPVGEHKGALRLGIENMAIKGLQGRAVMVDLFQQVGRDREFIGYDGLMRAMAATGAEVECGDMLCLYTGFADMILDSKGDPDAHTLHNTYAVLDGRDERLLRWITDSGVVALIADNYAVEGLPPKPGTGDRHAGIPIHEHCLFKLGVYLGELWYFTELNAWLKAHARTRFMLTGQPLRLTGAVGSPVTPIATV
jgi:kynurenine formamidase